MMPYPDATAGGGTLGSLIGGRPLTGAGGAR